MANSNFLLIAINRAAMWSQLSEIFMNLLHMFLRLNANSQVIFAHLALKSMVINLHQQ